MLKRALVLVPPLYLGMDSIFAAPAQLQTPESDGPYLYTVRAGED